MQSMQPVREKLWADIFAAARAENKFAGNPAHEADMAVRAFDQSRVLATAASGEPQAETQGCAECGGKQSTNDSMWALYCVDCITKIAPALAQPAVKESETLEALRAEALTLRNQRDELRLLLDKRPAFNAGLIEAYQKWSTSIYALDWLDALDDAARKASTEGK